MIPLLLLHVGTAALLAAVAASQRRREAGTPSGGLELCTALLLPGVGALMVSAQLLVEAVLDRTVRPRHHSHPLRPEETPEPAVLDPVQEIRIGVGVFPFTELLRFEEPATAELALQRLARAPSKPALARLKEALGSTERDLRVRARALLVRLEDRWMKRIRTAQGPLERGRAYQTLSELSMDSGTAREHLERASLAFQEGFARDSGFASGLELGRTLLRLDRPAEARSVFAECIRRRPTHPQGYLGRAQASLALGEPADVWKDLARFPALKARVAEAVEGGAA